MAKDIVIPDYQVLVPNSVWGKDVGLLTLQTGVQLPATKIVMICKYDTPDPQEALDFIQKAAKEYNPATALNEELSAKGEKPLSESMGLFEQNEIERIASGVPEVMDDLRKHCLESMLNLSMQPGKNYVQIITSTVPNNILAAAKAQIDQYGN